MFCGAQDEVEVLVVRCWEQKDELDGAMWPIQANRVRILVIFSITMFSL